MGAQKTFAGGAFVTAQFTSIDLEAAAVTQLSKYVLDYAPHTVAVAASIDAPAALRIAPRLEYKHRTRSTGTSDYALFDLRISRLFGAYEVRLEGTNLGDATYQEVVGIAIDANGERTPARMPGRAVTVSVAVRP